MKPRKPSLEDYVEAIVARDNGMPYPHVLDAFDITPNQFFKAAGREISDYITLTSGDTQKQLIEISNDKKRKRELFNMGKQFVREQYNKVQNDCQSRFFDGTLIHPENVKTIIYYALISHNHLLRSNDRKEVVETIKNLPSNLARYLFSIGLGGLMENFEKGKRGSPLAVLEVFDKVYREKTGDKSLFNLTHPEHLHRWGDNFRAPLSYWKKEDNIKEAIYHVLTENNPELSSKDRRRTINAIKDLSSNLQKYLWSIGLCGLMCHAFEKGRANSPLAVLEVFDRVYQEKIGDKSLFDLTQKEHLHRWGDKFGASRFYWQNMSNVKEAIYHVLTEDNPEIASQNRLVTINAIKDLPSNLVDYLHSMGLYGLMGNAFEKGKLNSPLVVLEVLDQVYQEKTGNPSLFDKTQNDYIEFGKGNRLVRK